MSIPRTKQEQRSRRRRRIRARVSGTGERPRLAVFKSHKHLYAQLIDDERGMTLAAVSDSDLAAGSAHAPRERAHKIGELIAAKGAEKKIAQVVFDRSGYQYSGKIRELADGARAGGLKF